MNVERRRVIYVLCFSLAVVALSYANALPNDFILGRWGYDRKNRKVAVSHLTESLLNSR